MSVDPTSEELRAAAYELLGAVCTYLNYDRSPVVAAQGEFIHNFGGNVILNRGFQLVLSRVTQIHL